VQWLAEGDKNTRFFHLRANQWKRKNKVASLRKPSGDLTEDPKEMADATTKFYRDLYQSEGTEDMAAVLDTVPVRVTEAMNKELIATISEKEVRVALSRCSLPKRRGLMDFRHIFFKDTGISAERR
jgi:hypothetical protein